MYLKYKIEKAVKLFNNTKGTAIIKYFKNGMIIQFLSAWESAITLHAAPIGDQAQPIEVQLFNHQAKAYQAADDKSQISLKCSKVETIVIL